MNKESAIKILDMFLDKQCSLGRVEFAYDADEIWDAVSTARDELEKNKTYEDGLADAWEAARKTLKIPLRVFDSMFPGETFGTVFENLEAQEVIAKIKAYEDIKGIMRGDEVANIRQGIKGIVIDTYQKPIEGKMIRVLWSSLYLIDYNRDEVEEKIEKTGRNFADKLDALLGEIGNG